MELSKVHDYITLDVHSTYNLLRVVKGIKWKMAFRMHYGYYELFVIPFALTNTLADFQRFIHDILHSFLDDFCMAYLDDILRYSEMFQEHQEQVKKILELLSKASLYMKRAKSQVFGSNNSSGRH